jgi:hypothetical protein
VQLPVSAPYLANSALSFGYAVNLQLSASVGSNQLTVSVLTAAGATPSAVSPVLTSFRDVTIANGDPVVISLQSALSITIASGNTMGCVSAQMCRLWAVEINNGGTAGVCLFNALSGTSVVPLNEAALQTSASGTTGGSSAQTYYCSISSVSAKAIRILGYIEIQETTAGTWATGPTLTQLFGPGVRHPGEFFNFQYAFTSTVTSTTSGSYVATTNLVAITPTSAANLIAIDTGATVEVNGGSATSCAIQIRRGTSTAVNGTFADFGNSTANAINTSLPHSAVDTPNSTSQQTYTVYMNSGGSGSNYPASTFFAWIKAFEIMSALPAPANDNDMLSAAG